MEMVRLPLFEFGRLLYLDGNLGVEVAERHEWQRRDEQALRVLAEDHVGGVLHHFERESSVEIRSRKSHLMAPCLMVH